MQRLVVEGELSALEAEEDTRDSVPVVCRSAYPTVHSYAAVEAGNLVGMRRVAERCMVLV